MTVFGGAYTVDHKPYAEKIMIVEEEQETPMHFHWAKMEDIINRGGRKVIPYQLMFIIIRNYRFFFKNERNYEIQ